MGPLLEVNLARILPNLRVPLPPKELLLKKQSCQVLRVLRDR